MAEWLQSCIFLWMIQLGVAKPLQYDRPYDNSLEAKGYSIWEGDIFRNRQSSPAFFMAPLDKYRLWLKRTVFYTVDHSAYDDSQKRLIQEAMNMIEDKTCIKFREREQEPDYVHIAPSEYNGCQSAIGRNGGNQLISLDNECFLNGPGVIVHELLHTLGLWHEHNRPDRDNYVTVIKQNIQQGFHSNFKKRKANVVDLLGIEYDYGSIMHYGMYDFSVEPGVKPTILPNADSYTLIGQKNSLSEKDVEKVNKLYKCDINDCPDPPKHESVTMEGDAPWTIGNSVDYACSVESRLIGSPRRFCRFDFKWSGTDPECIDASTSLTCNFEDDMCSWEQDPNDNFDWQRKTGSTITEHTGPMVDHTTEESTGFYVYAEASKPQKPGDVARLVTPKYLQTSEKTCLSLSYYMWGETVGTLSAYLRFEDKEDVKIWTEFGNLGPLWKTVRLAFSVPEQFKVVFECQIGKNYLSDIAIDDFVLRPCPSGKDITFTDVIIT